MEEENGEQAGKSAKYSNKQNDGGKLKWENKKKPPLVDGHHVGVLIWEYIICFSY